MTVIEERFTTSDVGEVERRMRQQYGTVRLTDGETTLVEDTFVAEEFFLDRLTFTGSFSVTAELPAFTTVVSHGDYRWADGAERGDARAAPLLIRPGRELEAICTDMSMIALTFDTDTLEHTARAIYADDGLRVRFDQSAPVDAALGEYYRNLLVHVAATLPLARESEMLRASLHRTAAAALLECFAFRGDREERRASTRARLDGYRRARSYIDAHASLPVTVADVAEAASLSVRQLRDAFRSWSPNGSTPAEALRRARLAAAHDELRAGDPLRGDTVAAVAVRWGSTPSAFARSYRRQYGRSPRETLER